MQTFEIKRPDGAMVAVVGAAVIGAATVAMGLAIFVGRDQTLTTNILIILCFMAACALGLGMINAWRTPMLTVTPHALVLPTFLGARSIPIGPAHPAGEFLGPFKSTGNNRLGKIEENKFVHFYTLDARGALVELVALHRASPDIPRIRRALSEVAGLKVETLKADPKAKRSAPDVSHWAVPA